MNVEEIARKMCYHSYAELETSNVSYPLEEYWERNREYFMKKAEIYLEVRECVETE